MPTNSNVHPLRSLKLFFVIVTTCFGFNTHCFAQNTTKPVKVFILAGQSNMEGHAKVSSFDHLAMNPETKHLLKDMRKEDGTPTTCERVWISYFTGSGDGGEGHGKLTAGYGARRNPTQDGGKIGPEFTFGITLEKSIEQPILIIKTAWGGKSLHTDYRPPSAGPFEFNQNQLDRIKQKGQDLEQIKQDRQEATGRYYRLMMKHVQHVLSDVGRVCPEYDANAGYELAGFVWFQGWNDMVASDVYPNRDQPGGYDLYSKLMADFIRDVRKDLKSPSLPFVIGVLGVNGPIENYDPSQKRHRNTHSNFRKAMAAPASFPEFKDNVTAVMTEHCWDPELAALRKKNQQVNQLAKKLRNANKGYPDQPETISPAEQKKQVKALSDKLLTKRDREISVGITNAEYHYLGSARIVGQIGVAFAEAILKLQE